MDDPNPPKKYYKRPIILANILWSATIQGEIVTLKAHLLDYVPQLGGPRGKIVEFTPAARVRMLKLIARLDWSRIKSGLFITLTFPDSVLPMVMDDRKKAKYVFFRSMENYLSRQVTALWRIEWKERLSGVHRGILCPHFHLIVPSVKYIPKELIKKWWGAALGVKGHLMTRVDSLTDRTKHAVYIAKYAAKLTSVTGLDYLAYRNIDGRHWGYQRKSLLPIHTPKDYLDLPADTVQKLRNLASQKLRHYDLRYDAGFSLFGKTFQANRETVGRILLDSGVVSE